MSAGENNGRKAPTRWRRKLVRFTGLVLVLLLGVGTYLSYFGFPRGLQNYLEKKFLPAGLQVRVERLHWSWRGAFHAHRVNVRSDKNLFVSLQATNVSVQVKFRDLFEPRKLLRQVRVNGGTLELRDQQESSPLILSNLNASISLPSPELLSVHHLQASISGSDFVFRGHVTNYLQRSRKLPPPPPRTNVVASARELLERLGPFLPQSSSFDFQWDLLDPNSGSGFFHAEGAAHTNRWFSTSTYTLDGRVIGTNVAEIRLNTRRARTAWGNSRQLALHLTISTNAGGWEIASTLTARRAALTNLPVRSVEQIYFTSRHRVSSALQPLGGDGLLQLHQLSGPEIKVASQGIRLTYEAPASATRPTNWLSHLQQFPTKIYFAGSNYLVRNVAVEAVLFQAEAISSNVVISNLTMSLPSEPGVLAGHASFSMSDRSIIAQVGSSLDVKKLAPLLPTNTQRWLAQYSWRTPPSVEATLNLVLPTFSTPLDNWVDEIRQSLNLSGQFKATEAAYKTINLQAAEGIFRYTNMMWDVGPLLLKRPEGPVHFSYVGDNTAKTFRFEVEGCLNPQLASGVLQENEPPWLPLLTWNDPLYVDGWIAGKWNDPESIRFEARVAATNVLYKNVRADAASGMLFYEDRKLLVTNGAFFRADKKITMPRVLLDFGAMQAHFSNVLSEVDPQLVGTAIGEATAEFLADYQFVATPPVVRVNGRICLTNHLDVNLRFDIGGSNFRWGKLEAEQITGEVYWTNTTVHLSNVQGSAYGGGSLEGFADFYVKEDEGCRFNFSVQFKELDAALLHQKLQSSGNRTNHIQGAVSGLLLVSDADSEDLKSWQGRGNVSMRDGVLWEIPVFGAFSPILNAISPGLGSTPVKQAAATFTISNSVIHSDDLELRAPLFRMKYQGTVDFEENVSAKVEAELFRDAWVVGKVLSILFTPLTKLFEYQITGNLAAPKTEPLHIPQFLVSTLRPFQTLRKMMDEKEKEKERPATPPSP